MPSSRVVIDLELYAWRGWLDVCMSWLHVGGSRQPLGDGRAWGKPPSARLELARIADYSWERGLAASLAAGRDWTC